MGVQGLWKLLEPSGRSVALETLSGKVLAVDISLWLHQALYGVRDGEGQAVSNAHLLVLFNRICKLLYFGVKPVFVFDGAAPSLKIKTLGTRQKRRHAAKKQSRKLAEKLLRNTLMTQALGTAGGGGEVPASAPVMDPVKDDPFILPPIPEDSPIVIPEETPYASEPAGESTDESDEDAPPLAPRVKGLHDQLSSVDVFGDHFSSLPPEIQHELIVEKQQLDRRNKYRHFEDVPEDAGQFSSLQLDRLLTRRRLSQRLGALRKEMASNTSISLQPEGGGGAGGGVREVETRRIASKESTHYILFKTTPTTSETEGEESVGTSSDSNLHTSLRSIPEPNVHRSRSNMADSSPTTSGTSTPAATSEDVQLQEAILSSMQGLPHCHGNIEHQNDSPTKDSHKLYHTDRLGGVESSKLLKVPEMEEIVEEVLSGEQDCESLEKAEIISSSLNESPKAEAFAVASFSSPSSSDKKGSEREAETGDHQSTSGRSGIVADSDNVATVFNAGNAQKDVVVDDGDDDGDVGEDDNKAVDSGEGDDSVDDDKGDGDGGERVGEDTNEVEFMSSSGSSCEMSEDETDKPINQADNTIIRLDPSTSKADDDDDVHIDITGTSDHTDLPDEVVSPEDIGRGREQGQLGGSMADSRAQSASSLSVFQSLAEGEDMRTQFIQDINELSSVDHLQQLAQERSALRREEGQQSRLATEMTSHIYREAQDLLSMFRLPYVVSPGEAEAQCAWLDAHHPQIEGTITDDNDYLLFGGRRLYRHFFSLNHQAEVYSAADIQHCLGVSRDQLILVAMLTGSDYTDGINGAGVVTAMEILRDFPGQGLAPLKAFKEWHSTNSLSNLFEKKQKKRRLLSLSVPPCFPEDQVFQAYCSPSVDPSADSFQWGLPDSWELKEYARVKLGWSDQKVQDTIAPVLKRLNQRKESQLKITQFMNLPKIAPDNRTIKSKRVRRAVARMQSAAMETKTVSDSIELSESSSDDDDGEVDSGCGSQVKRRTLSSPQKEQTSASSANSQATRGRGRGRGRGHGKSRISQPKV